MECVKVWDQNVWISILKDKHPDRWRIIPEQDIEEFAVNAPDNDGAREEAIKMLRKVME